MVVELAPSLKPKQGRYWFCRCDCGARVVVRGKDLPNGNTSSCGCAQMSGARQPIMLTVNGQTLSMSEWSRRVGGTDTMVRDRLLRGWTPEAAVSAPAAPKKRKRAASPVRQDDPAAPITHGGLTLSRAEWSRRLGGSRYLVRQRLKYGFSIEEAVTKPYKPSGRGGE